MSLKLPVAFVLLLLQSRDQRKNGLKSYARQVAQDGDTFGPDNWRGIVQASLSLLQVELVQLRRQLFILVQEETRQKVWNGVSVLSRKFVDNLLEHS